MKKLYRNIIVLFIASCFSALIFVEEQASAQTKNTANSTSPSKAKKSPTANAKPTPNSTSVGKKPDITPTATSLQIIVTATAVSIRQQPSARSNRLMTVKLGKILLVIEKNGAAYRVQYAQGKSGWISAAYAKDFQFANRDEIYREIADRYSKNKALDFAVALEVAEFLRIAQASAGTFELQADLSLKRLRVLGSALKTIPSGKSETFPYKSFLKANEKEVVYSEPSGEWYVRSDLFWELHGNFIKLPTAEEIAWEAARNPMPGECEGYINCNLYQLRATDAEYLNFYPNGKYSKKALQSINNLLDISVAAMNNKALYTPLTDVGERAEFNRFLTELRAIISKVPHFEKSRALQQISQLGEGYK